MNLAGLVRFIFIFIFEVVCLSAQTTSSIPWIQGEYVLTYAYNERRFDQSSKVVPPCLGPVPYTYTFTIQIIQAVGSSDFSYCYTNTNCAQLTFKGSLQESTQENVRSACTFQSYQGYSLLSNTNLQDIAPTTTAAMVPKGVDGKELGSYSFSDFTLPQDSSTSVWGSFCKQYSWPENSRGRNRQGFGNKYWSGAWRHENETWVFLRDVTTCPCYPACAKCQRKVPSAKNMYEVQFGVVGETCLESFGVASSQCNFKLVGVGGGALEFYESTTGYLPMPDGSPQRCYSYYTVTGVQTQSAKELQMKMGG